MLKKGTVVKTVSNEYVVQKQVTQGGNGTIFQVTDDTKTVYALKAIDRAKTSKDKLKRFRNEIAFCSNNRHPNIVPVLDSGTYTSDSVDLVFYVMPFYPQTLRALINSGIIGERALALFSEIADGLKFAHQKGVWHRDIKPENILIDGQGHAIIADFGIAHFCEEELATFVETTKHDRLANFQYAAPEQRNRGQSVDGRADVFSLGLILNEMFTKSIISGVNYRTIADVAGDYGYLDEVVSKLICQNPQDRLYPIERIAVEILALQKKAENEKELKRLAEEKPVDDLEAGVIEPPTVVDISYDDGYLKLTLKGIPSYGRDVWFSCLMGGSYGYTSVMGYDPNQLRLFNPDIIAMPMRRESVDLIKQMAGYIKGWLPPATNLFNQQIRSMNRRRKQEEEERIRSEIQRRKADNALKDMLREMI